MLGTFDFNPGPWHQHVAAPDERVQLSVKIRHTDRGASIRFSDGRMFWLPRESHVTDSTFLVAVTSWAKRRGARSVEILFEQDSTDEAPS